ncbi:50S ribosomal protein L18, chloroplastic [Glycine soja]|uniref:50S ribosomal protein L18, chloroplastic n=1 Tax=Glycine soja TaxID=3848 RepID=A0A445GFW1_GLYSO|nr:50S ribosomal protein L18, chloroplastic [Glycine soja]
MSILNSLFEGWDPMRSVSAPARALVQCGAKYHEAEHRKFGEEGSKYFRYANEDISLSSWLLSLEVEHVNALWALLRAPAKLLEVTKRMGEIIAKSCLEKGITKVAFDRGGYPYHDHVQALAEAAREHGDVSSIGACRPRIFFINGFLCFLEDEWLRNGEGRERRDATSRRR